MKSNRSKRNSDRFWLIYMISAVVLLFAVIASLFVFYDFMDAFEASQPQSPADAAKKYASAMTVGDVTQLLSDFAKNEPLLDEESSAKIVSELAALWDTEKMFCKKASDAGDDETPVYSAISNGKEIFRITLKKEPIGRYGFDAWVVASVEATLDGCNIYTITAPAGATVTVNSTPLGESFIVEKDIPYEYKDFEKSVQGLPTAVRYETGLLEGIPTVSASLGGAELSVTSVDGGFSVLYPEALLYNATVKVPSGSVVTSNGIDISDSAEKATESAFSGLIADGLTVPEFDIYTLTGLYTPLDNVTVTLDGTIKAYETSNENGTQHFLVDIGSYENAEVETFAKDFTKAYFYYTSRGYQNTAENLAAALAYVKSDTELYKRIKDSKVGYDFVTPITSEVYNKFEVSRIYPLEDASYVVMIEFDIDHKIYSHSRSYKGEISLHVVSGGEYKIANMVIVNE